MIEDPQDPLKIFRDHESTGLRTFGMSETPPLLVSGEGARLYDAAGRDYLDFACGSGVTTLGHGHPAIRKAIQAQLDTGIWHIGAHLPHGRRAELYQELLAVLPAELTRINPANTGAEAVEVAVKAARFATGRTEIIAFQGGYQGRTAGALSVTSYARIKRPFLPLMPGVIHVPYPYPRRSPFGRYGRTAEECAALCLEFLDQALSNPAGGVTDPAAILVEPIQAVGGVIIPPPGFLRELRLLCDRYGLLLVVDEVFTGFARTGRWFAFQYDGVVPDLVILAKGLSGSLPLAAVVGREEILGRWDPGLHSSTFHGNPVACAAAVASIRAIREEGLVERANEVGRWITEAYPQLRDIPIVGDCRGIGALHGIEIVEPEDGRPAPARIKRIRSEGVHRGLLLWECGWYGNVIGLVPPVVITRTEVGRAMDILAAILREEAQRAGEA